jgi:hypothetical protein
MEEGIKHPQYSLNSMHPEPRSFSSTAVSLKPYTHGYPNILYTQIKRKWEEKIICPMSEPGIQKGMFNS